MLSRLPSAWPLIALLGPILAYVATSTCGPGVSGDSLRYLSVAQNIRAGLGLVDYSLQPLLAWPPLYPYVLAAGSLLAPDVFVFGWILNTLLFGLNIFLAGKLAATLLPGFAPAPMLVSLVVLSSSSVLRLHTSIASDPLFLSLVLSFLLLSTRFLTTGHKPSLAWSLALAACAGLVKYPGLALALIGGAVTLRFYLQKKQMVQGCVYGLGFTALAGLPLAAWVFFHNYLQYGSMFGERGSGPPLDNLYVTLEKMLYWFIPYSLVGSAGPYLLLLGLVILACLAFRPVTWKNLARQLASASFFSSTLFFGLYFLMMIFLTSYAEHKDYREDRLHILFFIPLLYFLLALFSAADLRWKLPLPIAKFLTINVLAILWLAYPLNNTVKYVRASLDYGEIGGNLYNTLAINRSDIVAYLRANPLPTDATLYSNHEGAAWFYTRRNTLSMPQGEVAENERVDVKKALAAYQDWPPAPGYIIWFDLDFKLHVIRPDDLRPLAEIEPVFTGKQGAIYRVIKP